MTFDIGVIVQEELNVGDRSFMASKQSQPESNTLGLAGFIVSLVGWVTCGVLCPVGALLSLIALARRPRGFAVAGLVVGLLGSGFLLFFGLTILAAMMVPALGAAKETANLIKAETTITAIYNDTGALPSDADAALELGAQQGLSADDIRYQKLSDSTYQFTQPGWDGTFGTDDDRITTKDVTQRGSSGTP